MTPIQARVARGKEHERMEPKFILAVAAGGACGSVARYLVAIGSAKLFGSSFPWGTLIINVTGSALIGVFVGLFAAKWDLSQAARIFLTVGICGGYTTFSTFSLDVWYLIERGQVAASMAYMLASVVLSLAALVGALHAVRALG
jgi:CrcB protein